MTGRLRNLAADRNGLALLEFAFSLPIVLGIGLYGIETANLALMNLRVSQVALNLADNAARVGLTTSLSTEQLREIDMNDVLQAAQKQSSGWALTTRGRVTVSSLEADANGNQIIHWQRCIGLKSGTGYDSSYGITATSGISTGSTYDPTAGTNTATDGTDNSASHPGSTSVGGMGDTGSKVTAPASSGVIFVEVNYDYNPIVSTKWLSGGASKLHYIASFIVRDNREFKELYNPSPKATGMTCDKHTSS